jgi:hypothetical protein
MTRNASVCFAVILCLFGLALVLDAAANVAWGQDPIPTSTETTGCPHKTVNDGMQFCLTTIKFCNTQQTQASCEAGAQQFVDNASLNPSACDVPKNNTKCNQPLLPCYSSINCIWNPNAPVHKCTDGTTRGDIISTSIRVEAPCN